MIEHFKRFVAYRELLTSWTLREIKIRYKQSVLGIGWAILQPLLLMIIFTLVFSKIARVSTDGIPYPIFSYSALLPWTFLATSITFGVPSLVNNMNLVTKIYFPREIFPFAAVGASFIDFVVASVIFIGMIIFYKVSLSITLLFLPLLLLIQILLTLGICLFGAAMNVFYRDIRFLVPLGLQLWMFLSPVIYPVTLVPERYRGIYMLNPMAGLIDSYREVLLCGRVPHFRTVGLAALISVALFLLSYWYFKRVEMRFADVI